MYVSYQNQIYHLSDFHVRRSFDSDVSSNIKSLDQNKITEQREMEELDRIRLRDNLKI